MREWMSKALAFAAAALIAIPATAALAPCPDDDCHAADAPAFCACLCHSPLSLPPDSPVFTRAANDTRLAPEPSDPSTLLAPDIFRPPNC